MDEVRIAKVNTIITGFLIDYYWPPVRGMVSGKKIRKLSL